MFDLVEFCKNCYYIILKIMIEDFSLIRSANLKWTPFKVKIPCYL